MQTVKYWSSFFLFYRLFTTQGNNANDIWLKFCPLDFILNIIQLIKYTKRIVVSKLQ